ncbi:MAG: ATP-binding protein [Endomicrobiia bacterium]
MLPIFCINKILINDNNMNNYVISIASGKGGTGKTTVAVNFALSLNNVQFLDCDVEEPNANLFLKAAISKTIDALISVPKIDENLCNYCGKCQEVCQYKSLAIIPSSNNSKGIVLTFPHLCHSCGACVYICPKTAIEEVDKKIGEIEIGNRGDILFASGKLSIGEIMSPYLIKQVKKNINKSRNVIIDAPPGTSCPVIETVKHTDFCVLVTEPTPFGLNDLILAVDVLKKLKIPFGVVINRSDIWNNMINMYCNEENIPILMEIPFDMGIARLYSNGIPFVEKMPHYKQEFIRMFEQIKRILE